MNTAEDNLIKEEDNGSQTIRKFKHGEVIDLLNEDSGDEKIEEKKEETGNYGLELIEVKSEDQSSAHLNLKANPIFLSQADLKRLALQHLGKQDLFFGMETEIEAPQMKMDKKGGSGSKKSSQRWQRERDSDDEEVDRDMQKMISNLKKQVLNPFKAQTKEKMLFTIGFTLKKHRTSSVSLENRLLYFPMIFLNHGLHLYLECFYLTSQQGLSELQCKVNFLPCNEDMREAVTELFIQCVADLQNEGLEWSITRLSNLSTGTWTRVNWDLKAQRKLIEMESAPSSESQSQQKDIKSSEKKATEKKPASEIITDQVHGLLRDQEKNYKKRTLSIGWVNSAVNNKGMKNFVGAMLSRELPVLVTCSSRSGNGLSFNRVDLLPSNDVTRDNILEVLFGELVCSVMDDENFGLKEVMDLPLSEGRNNWRYVSIH